MKKIFSAAISGLLLAGCISGGKKIDNKKTLKYPQAYSLLRTDAPALTFPAVMPIYGTDDRNLTNTRALMQHLYETGGITHFAISFPLNPQGGNPYEKTAVYAERFARLKKLVKNPDFKIGILMQQTIGMSATWNKNPNRTLTWQRTVTMENAPSIRFCPLDPDFRKYIKNGVAGLFKSKPDFILFDDDTRLYIQNQVECFCPRHVDYFNKKYGTKYTPAELQSAMKKAPAGALILKQFADARRETLADYVKMIRDELDKVNPGAPGIYCTNARHVNEMLHYARAAAGNNPVMIRNATGGYLERSVRDIVLKKGHGEAIGVMHEGKIDVLLDESDTCPHNLFSKTAQTMHFHIVFGLLHGYNGGKLWIANTRFYAPEPIKKYAQIIGKNQGLYRELNRTLKGVKWHGAQRSLPAPENDPRPDFPGRYYHIFEWEGRMTGYFGLPHRCAMATRKGIHMLIGEQIRYFSDAELERFLSDGCLLDASAATELAKRGFAKLVGVVPQVLTAKTSSGEWMKSMNYPTRLFGSKKYKLVPADAKARPEYISEFRDIKYNQADVTTKVCDGAALFVNAKGAKVVTVPFDVCDSRISIVPERQEYMRKIFDILGVLPAWSAEPFDVYFRFGTLANGKQDVAAVCNISYEPMNEVNIGVKKIPAKIEKISADGGWDVCKFNVKGNIITIEDKLRCADIGVYKFSY